MQLWAPESEEFSLSNGAPVQRGLMEGNNWSRLKAPEAKRLGQLNPESSLSLTEGKLVLTFWNQSCRFHHFHAHNFSFFQNYNYAVPPRVLFLAGCKSFMLVQTAITLSHENVSWEYHSISQHTIDLLSECIRSYSTKACGCVCVCVCVCVYAWQGFVHIIPQTFNANYRVTLIKSRINFTY